VHNAITKVRRDVTWEEVSILIARGEDASRVFMDIALEDMKINRM
jgi:hypothetical protein